MACRDLMGADAQVALPVRGMWAGLAGAGQEGARAAVEAGLRDAGLAENGVLMEAVKGIALDLGCDVHPAPVVPERGALRNAIRGAR